MRFPLGYPTDKRVLLHTGENLERVPFPDVEHNAETIPDPQPALGSFSKEHLEDLARQTPIGGSVRSDWSGVRS